MLQERALGGVVGTENEAAPRVLAISDRWRCMDHGCSNWNHVCWRQRTSTVPERAKDHHPIVSKQLANWANDLTARLCTIDEPSDRVRLALLTYKRNREREERVVEKLPSLDEQLRHMQRIFLMRELQQMSSNSAQLVAPAAFAPTLKTSWKDLEYVVPQKMHHHNVNFIAYLRDYVEEDICNTIEEQVVKQAKFDINFLMDGLERHANGDVDSDIPARTR